MNVEIRVIVTDCQSKRSLSPCVLQEIDDLLHKESFILSLLIGLNLFDILCTTNII